MLCIQSCTAQWAAESAQQIPIRCIIIIVTIIINIKYVTVRLHILSCCCAPPHREWGLGVRREICMDGEFCTHDCPCHDNTCAHQPWSVRRKMKSSGLPSSSTSVQLSHFIWEAGTFSCSSVPILQKPLCNYQLPCSLLSSSHHLFAFLCLFKKLFY